jgi:hypothetical protein
MRAKFKEPTKREREETAAERELCRFVVWAVYGYNPGNYVLLATFPYKQLADANAYARTTYGGYVMRERRRTQPATVNVATLPVFKFTPGCHTKPATVAEQPADTLPPIVPTHVVKWV